MAVHIGYIKRRGQLDMAQLDQAYEVLQGLEASSERKIIQFGF